MKKGMKKGWSTVKCPLCGQEVMIRTSLKKWYKSISAAEKVKYLDHSEIHFCQPKEVTNFTRKDFYDALVKQWTWMWLHPGMPKDEWTGVKRYCYHGSNDDFVRLFINNSHCFGCFYVKTILNAGCFDCIMDWGKNKHGQNITCTEGGSPFNKWDSADDDRISIECRRWLNEDDEYKEERNFRKQLAIAEMARYAREITLLPYVAEGGRSRV